MDKGPKQIGAFEAKTKLAELLRDAEAGQTYVVRRRGRVVAKIVPASEGRDSAAFEKVKAAILTFRRRSKGKVDVRALIEEGRRL